MYSNSERERETIEWMAVFYSFNKMYSNCRKPEFMELSSKHFRRDYIQSKVFDLLLLFFLLPLCNDIHLTYYDNDFDRRCKSSSEIVSNRISVYDFSSGLSGIRNTFGNKRWTLDIVVKHMTFLTFARFSTN